MNNSTVAHAVEKQQAVAGEMALSILISDIIRHDMFAIDGVLVVTDEWYFNQAEVLKLLLGLECQSEKIEVLRAIRRSKPHMPNMEFKNFLVGLSILCRKHKKLLAEFL